MSDAGRFPCCVCRQNGIGDDQFAQLRCGHARHCSSGKHAMRDIGHYILGACGFQCGGSVTKRARRIDDVIDERSEEHTSELQSLMRISYAVFCLKKKTL